MMLKENNDYRCDVNILNNVKKLIRGMKFVLCENDFHQYTKPQIRYYYSLQKHLHMGCLIQGLLTNRVLSVK